MQSVIIRESPPMGMSVALGREILGPKDKKGLILPVHQFGRNPSVGTTAEGFHRLGGAVPFLTDSSTIRIKAGGNAADDSDGDGARTVRVKGIDDSFNLIEVVLTTNGASASTATTEEFWRIYDVQVETVGVYGAANTGAIVIEAVTGPVDLATIPAGVGAAQMGFIATPATHRLIVTHVEFDLNIASEAITLEALTRSSFDVTTAPMGPQISLGEWPLVSRRLVLDLREAPYVIEPKADFWFEGATAQDTGTASIRFSGYFVEV